VRHVRLDSRVTTLGPEVLRDLLQASHREWILADGLGGWACSTPLGLNSRRGHGLLVVGGPAPGPRRVLLSKVEETLVVGDRRCELATNHYPGTVHPRGFEWAVSFSLDPLPSLTWQVAGIRVTRTVARIHRTPGTAIVWAVEGDAADVVLELRPIVAFRDAEALQSDNDAFRREVVRRGDDVVLAPYDDYPTLQLRVARSRWQPDGHWYRRFEYALDWERGEAFAEDLYSPGIFSVRPDPERPASLLAWAGPVPEGRDAEDLVAAERKRLWELGPRADGLAGDLRRAADAFLIQANGSRTILTGHPVAEESVIEALVSVPGLCLATGRPGIARSVLAEAAKRTEPPASPVERTDPQDAPPPPGVDAALWMILTLQRYFEATGDRGFVRQRFPGSVASILEGFRSGAFPGIELTAEGLLSVGEARGLGWMEAGGGHGARRSRSGQPVEVQALWYNALLAGADLARALGDDARAEDWTSLAGLARHSFQRSFWCAGRRHLADVARGEDPDVSLRPNQLYAVGLPHALVPRDKALDVLESARGSLLTTVGLRTLAPSEPGYAGRFEGGLYDGTVWPHLVGVYFDALIRVHGEEGKREGREWLRRFATHLDEAGLGTVSQYFDGDPPHRPGGAFARAWGVAELLRLATRLEGKPPSRDRR
jgi:predicted glycogen debranching enzyme